MKEAVEQEKAKLPKIFSFFKKKDEIAASTNKQEESEGKPVASNSITLSRQHLKSESNTTTNQDVGLDNYIATLGKSVPTYCFS